MRITAIDQKDSAYSLQIKLASWEEEEMPVAAGTPVIVLHRDGELFIGKAGNSISEDWEHDGSPGDIIAWAEVKVPQLLEDAIRLL